MGEIASVYAKVGVSMDGFRRGMSEMDSTLNKSGSAFRNFTTGIVQGIGQAFGQAIIGGVRNLTDAMAGTLAAAAGMEQGVANIAAVMDLTAESTAQVDKLISDLGIDPKLKVTAFEAAGAIEMLGKNGLKLDEILGGAARSTILLSNSTGGDFAMSADIATSAMAQFKIKAEDMAGAVDQIVGVTKNSKFDINDYRLAISQAGGVAASVGVSFEDFNATIAAISPLFASGSDAGTSFKTFLQRLVPDTAPATEAMKELGIVTADGQNQFFTASGEMKSMSEIAGVLKTAFVGLSEEQKINAATSIFGTDAMRAAFALADGGAGIIDKLKLSIGNTNAEESAATRMDTLSGVWEIFQGIVESLSIQFGKAFLPAARDVVQILTDLATRIGPQVAEWGQKFGERLKIVTDAAIGLVNIGLAEGWQTLFTPLADGSMHLDKLFVSFGMTDGEARKTRETLFTTMETVKSFTVSIAAAIVQIKDVLGPLALFIRDTIGLENALKAIGVVMAASFVAPVLSAIISIASIVGSIAGFVASLTGLGTIATMIGGAVVAAISAIGAPVLLVGAAIATLVVAWRQNWGDIQGITKNAWEMIKTTVSDGVAVVKKFFDVSAWVETGKNLMQGLVDGIKAGWNWVVDTARGAANAALDAAKKSLGINSPSKAFEDIGRYVMDGFSNGLGQDAGAKAALNASLQAIKNDGVAYTSGTFAAQMFAEASKALRSFGDGFRSGSPDLGGDLQRMLASLPNAFNTVMDSFKRHVFSVMQGIGQDIGNGMVQGIRDKISSIVDVLNYLAQLAPEWVRKALGINSPSKVFIEIGKQVTAGFAKGIEDNMSMPEMSLNSMVRHTVEAAPGGTASASMAGQDGGTRRIEIVVRGESALPADRAKLRELAQALQREFNYSGARVAVA